MSKTFVIYFCLTLLLGGSCTARKKTSDKETASAESKREIRTKELVLKGTTEKVIGNYDIAEKYFQECIKISPKTAVAYFELSEIYQYKKDAQKSLDYGQMAFKLAPNNEWYELNMAYLYMRTGQVELAEKTFLSLNKKYPGTVDYLYQLSEIYLYQKKYSEAIAIYNQLENSVGINEELALQKSTIYLELNEPNKAILEIKKLIDSQPNEMRFLGLLADLYEQLNRSDEAFELYSKILELEPSNGFVHLSLSDYYSYRSQSEKSFEEMKKAFWSENVDLKTKGAKLEGYYVNSASNATKKQEAYELLEILIKVHPQDYQAFVYYAEFLERDDRIEEMITMLTKATSLGVSEFNVWYKLCSLLWEKGQFEQLVIESDKAIELFPSLPSFYYLSGLGNVQLKKYDKALESLEIGVDYCLDNNELKAEFYQYLGDACNALKEYEKSDMYYDQSLAIDPNNVYVLNNYSYYLTLRKVNLEKARVMAEKVNRIIPNNANYLDTYAWVFFAKKDYVKAEELLAKSLTLGGDSNPEILEHYGDVQFHLNNAAKALEYWQKSKDKGGNSPSLLKKISTKTFVE